MAHLVNIWVLYFLENTPPLSFGSSNHIRYGFSMEVLAAPTPLSQTQKDARVRLQAMTIENF